MQHIAPPPSPPALSALMEAAGAVGLVVTKAEGGWIASVEEARGSWRDGPVCVGPDEAVAALVVVKVPEPIPFPKPVAAPAAIAPPPY